MEQSLPSDIRYQLQHQVARCKRRRFTLCECGFLRTSFTSKTLGSVGPEMAWVGAGKREAYFTTRIEPWDVAPGVLLVQEAGGRVSDFQGKPWQPQTGDLLFSNKKLHERILGVLSAK